MRSLLALAALILALAPAAAPAQTRSLQTIDVGPGTQVDWSQQQHPRPVVYRFGDVSLEVRGIESDDLFAPRVTVRHGRASAVMNGSATMANYDHRLGVGTFDRRGTRFVYFQSFTGGAHCCNEVQVALVGPAGIRIVSLGSFDGDMDESLPRDVDGDGLVDFVVSDDSLLYTFSSYAGSFALPKIVNIVDGRVVDVSTRPGFRGLFREAAASAKTACASGEGERNGACAAYVAASARVGQFDNAWAEVLRVYDRNSSWGLPTGCRVAPNANGVCPDASTIHYRDYPEALRAFLVRQGYLNR
jgi:hypothetical protein